LVIEVHFSRQKTGPALAAYAGEILHRGIRKFKD